MLYTFTSWNNAPSELSSYVVDLKKDMVHFGLQLLFSPNQILSWQRKSRQLQFSDELFSALLKNRQHVVMATFHKVKIVEPSPPMQKFKDGDVIILLRAINLLDVPADVFSVYCSCDDNDFSVISYLCGCPAAVRSTLFAGAGAIRQRCVQACWWEYCLQSSQRPAFVGGTEWRIDSWSTDIFEIQTEKESVKWKLGEVRAAFGTTVH